MSTVPPAPGAPEAPASRWSVRAPPVPPASTGAHVGDVFLRAVNGTLFLNMFQDISYALFREDPERESKDAAELQLTTFHVKSCRTEAGKRNHWRSVGTFYFDLAAGEGHGSIPVFGAHTFTLKRQPPKPTAPNEKPV